MSNHPLVVDLDGTLIRTDLLHESAFKVLRDYPLDALRIPYWLSQGKAVLKRNLMERASIDPGTLPYNQDLLDWLEAQRAKGRSLVLCTASDASMATKIARHLGIFEDVIASDGVINLAGENKAQELVRRFGSTGFDYIGNSKADLIVWKQARRGVVVNTSTTLKRKAAACCEVEKVFDYPSLDFKTLFRLLRVHQWLKNLLLFVPVVAAQKLVNMDILTTMLVAFFSFSLCASSVYIANDLLDLESDRQHPRKKDRGFASGTVPIWLGVLLAPLLLLCSLALTQLVNSAFLPWLLVYFSVTFAYSFGLKRIMLVDCLTLAILYTLRIITGASAASLGMSFWLLAFSIFLFLSLAFIKRYAELQIQIDDKNQKIHGRGYYTSDASLIQVMGITAGYAAVLVLALYINSDTVLQLYRTPEVIWGTVPIMLFWVSWVWMQANRGHMHDDPLVFAVSDKASLLAGFLFALVLLSGAVGWPW